MDTDEYFQDVMEKNLMWVGKALKGLSDCKVL